MSARIITLSEEAETALSEGRAVVALESSVIAQGLPRPTNFDAAIEVERAIRDAGAVPATLAVVDGVIHAGLSRDQIEYLASTNGIGKAGARDLSLATACEQTVATTVSASLVIARTAGIRVFATGGVGGVHRNSELTGDVSSDLYVMARTPVVTVSSGFKSILDLPRTIELLETLGVLVLGFKTESLPDFYGLESGFSVPLLNGPSDIASVFRQQRALGYDSGLLVVNPPPAKLALPRDELSDLVSGALRSAAAKGVNGKDVTPYLLRHMAHASDGRTVALNVALLVSNARVAAEIAVALASG